MTDRSCGMRVLAVAVAVVASQAVAADWPTYRHDAGRSGFTPEELDRDLYRQWTYRARHAPRPAWPEPVREVHLMAFDYAYQVAASGGLVYFGSSADHQVYALELATGRQRWSFFTDGPVRFAPTVHHRRVFVGSDDGSVYCLSAAGGKLIWRRRGGPADQRILGNESMISRWPLRSGLAVDGDTLYFTAGMWPSEGVYTCAMKTDDGAIVWKTQSTENFAPQGYLAAGATVLVAPAGRSKQHVIDRSTGKLRPGKGTSQAVVKGDLVFSGPSTHSANENLPTEDGWQFAPRNRQILAWSLNGDQTWKFAGKECSAVSDDAIYLAGEGKIAAHRLGDMDKIWEIDHPRVFSLAVAGKTLVAGGDDRVALLDATGGQELWSAAVDGEARGLAVADGRLLVSTHRGHIVCFGPTEPAAAATITPGSHIPGLAGKHLHPQWVAGAKRSGAPGDSGSRQSLEGQDSHRAALAGQILQDTGIAAGFCFMAGVGDGRLALQLARQSNLRIYCAEPEEGKVAAARRLLNAAGLYGTRVTVHHVQSDTLPYPSYFANLIVVDETSGTDAPPWPPAELVRVLRPCGGTAYLVSRADAGGKTQHGPALKIAGEGLTNTRLSATAVKVVRGKLPGAGEWTHQYADAGKSGSSGDLLVRWPLNVLWFGKPGPRRMMNRHWRGTAPVCIDGRMFILGQHDVIAVDAYNGRELWSRQLPSIARRVVDIRGGSMVADRQSIYIANSDACLRLDAETGEPRQIYRLPLATPRFDLSAAPTIRLDDLAAVTLCTTAKTLQLELTTRDATVTNADRQQKPTGGDSWELFFDFRGVTKRTGLYGPGAFRAIVVPATKERPSASWHSSQDSPELPLDVAGTLDRQGSHTTVRIAWADIKELVGGEPAEFNFGAILNSSDDGKVLTKRTYRFANAASYRLANCRARMIVDADKVDRSAVDEPELLNFDQAEPLTWGNLIGSGELILGTIVAGDDSPSALVHGRDFSSEGHDYTGPPVAKVLGNLGLEAEARYVFALDKSDGRLRWIYTAAGAVPHNGIAVWNDRVYLLDKPGTAKSARLKRRGESSSQKASLEVLDLATGRRLWHIDEGLEDYQGLRLGKGVLLATHLHGLTAYDAGDGERLWSLGTTQPMHHCSAFVRAPVIAGDWVYDEPHAYRLRSGELKGPIGPQADGQAFRWGGFSGCGTVSASENMLFFRAGNPAFLDVVGGTGQHEFPGIRPGCYINIITAGGLVLMPEASSGCGCPYNFQTTVALMPE